MQGRHTYTRHASISIPSRTSKVYLIPIFVFHQSVFQPRPTGHTMSENSGTSFHPVTGPIDYLPPPRKSEVELSKMPQDSYALAPKLSPRPGEEREEREYVTIRPTTEVLDFDGSRMMQGGEGSKIVVPGAEEWDLERPTVGPGGEERMEEREPEAQVEELEPEIGEMCNSYEDVRRRTQRIRAKEELLKQTEKLLATRSAELSGVHAFLSTTDRLSEVEVLGIVHDLNENIYQVAVNLTDEWEKFESSQATDRMDIDPASRSHNSTAVQKVLSRNPGGLTFLLQSCLCSQVAKMTSSWGHHQELAILESIYQRLSASGGRNIINLKQYVTYIS